MRKDLSEGSVSYHEESDIYERFSQAEDTPRLIDRIILPYAKGKVVLDLGCGTGKYAREMALHAGKYIGLDVSSDQLRLAKRKVAGLKARFICSSAEEIKLPDSCVDLVISAWVIGTVRGVRRRTKIVKEGLRVLRKGGMFVLVENDLGGEFEAIRGRYPNLSRTKKYNDWLHARGFKAIRRIDTYFGFESAAEAKRVIGAIWGGKAAALVAGKKIRHRVIVFGMKKD